MRIIRILVVMLAAIAVIFPLIASANGTMKTETNINKTLLYLSGLFAPDVALAAEDVIESVQLSSAQIEIVKTPEELKNDKILARWREKQAAKWANLPKEAFMINASAYTAAADECDKSDGVTASGIKVQDKRTIACPPEFPFGAKIEIEGRGVYVCEDRGGAIKGNKIDIYMETKKEAFAFGRRNLMAKVVQ